MAKFLEEEIEPGLRCSYKLDKILASTTSKWQHVDLVDIQAFGRSLVIDGLLQSCRVDEFVYHECLVHPAMLLHPTGAKSVYIGGGGEGSTAREVLRHKSVESCVMVDIDEDVVRFCKEHLEENSEAFADKRLELVIDDAEAWLKNSPRTFDIIIMDLDDPLEGGPCYKLYTKEFYAFLKSKLNPGGLFVTQSGQSGIKAHTMVFSPINRTLRSVFDNVVPYNQAVYSFMDEWGWNLALTQDKAKAPAAYTAAEIDALIEKRITGELQFLDGVSWQGIWALSKKHRRTLAEEKVVMSTEGGTHRFMNNPGTATVAEAGKEEPPAKKQCV